MTNTPFYSNTFINLRCAFHLNLNKRHVLLALIALEYAVLLQVYCITCLGIQNDFICYIIIIYLAFAFGEGELGLTVIVYITRNHGNDYVSSIFPLW